MVAVTFECFLILLWTIWLSKYTLLLSWIPWKVNKCVRCSFVMFKLFDWYSDRFVDEKCKMRKNLNNLKIWIWMNEEVVCVSISPDKFHDFAEMRYIWLKFLSRLFTVRFPDFLDFILIFYWMSGIYSLLLYSVQSITVHHINGWMTLLYRIEKDTDCLIECNYCCFLCIYLAFSGVFS